MRDWLVQLTNVDGDPVHVVKSHITHIERHGVDKTAVHLTSGTVIVVKSTITKTLITIWPVDDE
jgi:uncharacterized protein YlzI (FlbEa/FlbD family)